MANKRKCTISPVFSMMFLLFVGLVAPAFGQMETTPLQFLKQAEAKLKDTAGEVYLGRVMTLTYPAYGISPHGRYHRLILELTDVLKTPLRDNYRLVLKGYSDNSGPSSGVNQDLSLKRAEALEKALIQKYYMDEKRITAEGHGEADPVASNETPRGRALNRRVEIHVYGRVFEAVRFLPKEEEVK